MGAWEGSWCASTQEESDPKQFGKARTIRDGGRRTIRVGARESTFGNWGKGIVLSKLERSQPCPAGMPPALPSPLLGWPALPSPCWGASSVSRLAGKTQPPTPKSRCEAAGCSRQGLKTSHKGLSSREKMALPPSFPARVQRSLTSL